MFQSPSTADKKQTALMRLYIIPLFFKGGGIIPLQFNLIMICQNEIKPHDTQLQKKRKSQ